APLFFRMLSGRGQHSDLHSFPTRRSSDLQYGFERSPLSAGKGIGGVAVAATQGTTGQPHEYRRPADGSRLSLQGKEDFGDSQALSRIVCVALNVRVHLIQSIEY